MEKNRSPLPSQIPSSVYLWVAVLIFAASNAVTRKVTQIGAQHLIDGRNPISLCNVLFVGNLCAFAVMLLIFGKQWNRRTLRQLNSGDWISLGAIAVLAGAVGPGLIFAALDNTSVTNVVLISRLEPPLTLVFSIIFLGARVNIWTAMGSMVSFAGVATAAVLANSGTTVPIMGGLFHVGRGELFAVIATFVLATATVTSKFRLQHVPIGIFNLVRVGLGAVIFFVLARSLYGPQHFVDIASPFLWKWMLLYGGVIVVGGQLFWLTGLRHATAAETSLASSFNPVAAIAMAYLILGEVPTMAQYTGGLIILVGIFLNLIGSWREIKSRQPLIRMTPDRQMEMVTGFKGV